MVLILKERRMLNNIVKYTAGACVASLVALSANASIIDQLTLAEKRAAPIYSTEKATSKTDRKQKRLDGHNFFMIKAGVAIPVQELEDSSHLNKPKGTYAAGVLIGREITDRFALDLEYMNRGISKASVTENSYITTWNLRSNAVMANVSLDLLKDYSLVPYLRAGVGVSRNQSSDHVGGAGTAVSITYPGKIQNQFAWQAGLGFKYQHTSMFSTVLEYMYVDHGKFSTQSSGTTVINGITNTIAKTAITGKLQDHVITLGVKINF